MDGISKIENRFQVKVEHNSLIELLLFLNSIHQDQPQISYVEKSFEEKLLIN